jgi:amino acid transporter
VGAPGALAQIVALITMGFVAYAFITFSRAFNTASSVYAYNGSALGPSYGFLSSWILLAVYVSFAAGVYASTGDITQAFLASIGIHLSWVPIAFIGGLVAIALAYLTIGISNIIILACEAVSVALIVVVAITVIIKGGYHGHGLTAAPFTLHGVGISVLALGVVGAFGQFSGFEGAAVLGEESAKSTETIPRAIAGSLIASALIYIFFTWIVYSAFPSVHAVATNPAPLVNVASIYLSPTVAKFVNVAGILSGFGAQLACINAGSRLIFALGREGGTGGKLRSALTTTSTKYRSPVGALTIVGVVSLIALGAFSFEATANRAAALIIQFGAYLILLAYLMTVIGALVWTLRTGRNALRTLILGVGVVVVGYVSYRSLTPLPAYPFNYVMIAAAVFVVIGGALLAIPSLRGRIRDSELLRVTHQIVQDREHS